MIVKIVRTKRLPERISAGRIAFVDGGETVDRPGFGLLLPKPRQHWNVAQLVELATVNRPVAGSSPAVPANFAV